MSLLDPLVRGGEVNLAPLQAAIDAAEAINAAQQTQLDGLAAQLDGFGDAQTAIDAIQNAAIDAAEAVNTAQSAAQAAIQAAQDAATIIDATHSADIAALQTTVGGHTSSIGSLGATVAANGVTLTSHQSAIDAWLAASPNLATLSAVDVRMFVPGRVLTNANIDDAIDAAIAWAVANTGAGLDGPGYIVTVPAGKWTLARPHVFPSFGAYRCAVGLQGAGMNSTIFLVETDPSATAAFTFGSASYTGPGVGMSFFLRVRGFSVVAKTEDNCKRTGLRMYGAVYPLIDDVRVRGLTASDATPEQGRGIEVLPVVENGQSVNSQFVTMRNCDVYGCMTGLYIRLSYPVSLDNVHSQGCHFANAVIQGSTVNWTNSGIQHSGAMGLWLDRWYGNRNMPAIVSGFDYTTGLPSATGVTCSAQVGGICTLSGGTLAGLGSREDRARWVRVTATGAADANKTKVTGVYKVHRVTAAGAIEIIKGSNHTSQAGCTVQFCEAENQVTLSVKNVYNEASSLTATIGAYRDSTGGSEYLLEGAEFQGGDFVIDAQLVKSVTVRNIRQSNSALKAARLFYVDSSEIDADISKIQADDYSYAGLKCLDNTAFQNATATKGTWRSANGGTMARLTSSLRELGAVEIWDVRKASKVSLTGDDVNSVAGLLQGVLMLPAATAPAGLKCKYTPLDSALDAPAVIGLTGAGAARANMEAVIPAAMLPTVPYGSTLILIGRVPDTVVAGARRFQAITRESSNFVQHIIGLHDNQYIATGPYAYFRTSGAQYPNIEGSSSYSLTADTEPHCWIASAAHSSSLGSQALSWDLEDYKPGGLRSVYPHHIPGVNLSVGIGAEHGAVNSGSLIWTVAAFIPRSLARAEHMRIMDLARNEFPLEV